jgi:hypothetical protein
LVTLIIWTIYFLVVLIYGRRIHFHPLIIIAVGIGIPAFFVRRYFFQQRFSLGAIEAKWLGKTD